MGVRAHRQRRLVVSGVYRDSTNHEGNASTVVIFLRGQPYISTTLSLVTLRHALRSEWPFVISVITNIDCNNTL